MTINRLALASALLLATVSLVSAQRSEGAIGESVPTAASQESGLDATNIRLDVTINDQSADGPPVKKSITLILANRGTGRVRSTGTLTQQFATPGMSTPDGKPLVSIRPVGEVQLNLDVEVMIISADTVRTMLTIEYTPGGKDPIPADGVVTRSPLNQTVTVNLTSGQPLAITQAADPLSDRRITVEATATIVR